MSFKFGIPKNDSEEKSEAVFNGQTTSVILPKNTSQSSIGGIVTSKSTNSTSSLGNISFGSANTQSLGTKNIQTLATSPNQTFGMTNNQGFGVKNSGTFGTTNCQTFEENNNNKPFGKTQSQTFGAAQGQTFGAGQGQTFGAAQGQTFGSTQGQTFGSAQGLTFGTPSTNNTQAFGGPTSTHAKGLFGAPGISRSGQRLSGLLYNNYVQPQPNFGTQNTGKLGAVNINVHEPITISDWNGQKGFIINSTNAQPNRWFGNPNDTGKLSTTNITVDQPITISTEDGVKFAIPHNNIQPGYFKPPGESGTAGTNINVNQPINITGCDDQTLQWFHTQPNLLFCPRPAEDMISKLCTTNITVHKPIRITGHGENNIKFGINPTTASNFGYNPLNVTSIAELGKLCSTNITVNKPITITGKNEPKFKFGIPSRGPF